jgi:hypothetical protein
MKAPVAVIADYANIEKSGKLNIMGIFGVINAPQVPCVHQQMSLIVRLVAEPSETNIPLPVQVQMIDEDGKIVSELKGQVLFPSAPTGEPSSADYILGLNNFVFEKFGDYDFKILVQDEPIATVPFRVRQVSAQPS